MRRTMAMGPRPPVVRIMGGQTPMAKQRVPVVKDSAAAHAFEIPEH